jgi:hypothetical protein
MSASRLRAGKNRKALAIIMRRKIMRYLIYAAIAWLGLMIVFACSGCNAKPYASMYDTGKVNKPIIIVGAEWRM